jgi:NADH-quinone oxidoreductase subunit N
MLLAVIKDGDFLWLAIVAILCAAVSVYYYFRVVQAMYFKDPNNEEQLDFSPSFRFIMLGVAIIILILGIHPDYLTGLL